MFKRILVPLDGSPRAEKSLDFALDLAQKYGAHVTLARICWTSVQVLTAGEIAMLGDIPNIEEEGARAYLAKLKEKHPEVDTQVHIGDPAECIIDLTSKAHYDLVVMNSHGRSGMARFIMGSVAERVARHAACPVLITRLS